MDLKNIMLIACCLLLFSTVFVSASNIIPPQFTGWRDPIITGNESIMYNYTLVGNEFCLKPHSLTELIIDKITFRLPSRIPIYDFEKKLLLKEIDTTFDYDLGKGGYCHELNPLETLIYKFGYQSVIIAGDTSYDSIDTNITQETGSAHLTTFDKLYSRGTTGFNLTTANTTFSPYWRDDSTENPTFTPYGTAATDRVVLDQTPVVNFTNATGFSVAFWVYYYSSASLQGGVRRGGVEYWRLNSRRFVADAPFFEFQVANATATEFNQARGAAMTDAEFTNRWWHVAGVYDLDNARLILYVNGEEDTNVSYDGDFDFGDSNGLYTIGETTGSLNGSIDDVFVFNSSLSADNISTLYGAGRGGAYSNPSIVGEYRFTDTSSTNTIDEAGFANGTISGDSAYGFVPEGLVAYWPFDADDNVTAIDYTSFDNDGTYEGSSNITADGMYNAGLRGKAITGDYVDTGVEFSQLQGEDFAFSFSMWINVAEDDDEFFEYIGIESTGGSLGWGLRKATAVDSMRLFVNNGTDSDTLVEFSGAIPTETWHHYIFTKNSTGGVAYLDGVVADTTSITGDLANGRDLFIGLAEVTSRTFNGTIDEVMIFDIGLTPAQVTAIFQNASSRFKNPGLMVFDDAPLGSYLYANVTIDRCGKALSNLTTDYNGTLLQFDSCAINNMDVRNGVGNFNISFTSNENQFSPFIAGDITITPFDPTTPGIVYVSPTPSNNTNVTKNVRVQWETGDDNIMYSFTDYDRSLVGWYRLEGNSFDNSTYGHDGTSIINVTNTSDGKFGDAMVFDGSTNQIDLFDFSPKINESFAFNIWINPAELGVARNIFGKPAGNWEYNFRLRNTDTLEYVHYNTAGTTIIAMTTVNTVNANEWAMATVNYNGTDAELYLNGVLEATDIDVVGVFQNRVQDTVLGFGYSPLGTYFNGTIDEFMMFNRSLSSDEIIALYNSSIQHTKAEFLNQTGDHIFRSYVVDGGGNVNTTGDINISIDLSEPDIDFVEPTPTQYNITSQTSVIINVTTSDDENNISSFIDWNSSLLLWYRMEGNALDNSTYGNNGTVTGDVANTTGRFGDGLFFDGDNDYITASNFDSLNTGDNMTLSVWFKRGTVPFIRFLGKGTSDGSISSWDYAFLLYADGDLAFGSGNGADSLWTGQRNINLAEDVWVHAVGTQSTNGTDTNTTLYINGDVIFSNVLTGIPTRGKSSDFYIARETASPTNNVFNGTLDEIMLFNRTLSVEEVSALYSASNYQVNFSALSDGNYTFKAYSQDFGGNVNQTELREIEIISAVPPVVPNITITLVSPVNDSNLTISNPNFTATMQSLNANITNATLWSWYLNGSTFNSSFLELDNNETITNTWFTNFTFPNGTFLWNVHGCAVLESASNCSFALNNFTLNINTTVAPEPSAPTCKKFKINNLETNETVFFVDCKGNLEANGNLTLDGNLNVTGDLTANTNITVEDRFFLPNGGSIGDNATCAFIFFDSSGVEVSNIGCT